MSVAVPGNVAGIVLAGGRGVRFGGDKLAADFGGRPLLHRPIEALATVCREIVVVAGADGGLSVPGDLRVPLRIVRDEEPGAGPLAGLLTGLRAATGSIVIVVGGDMPSLVPDLLHELARRAGETGVAAAVLLVGDAVRPLPCALRRDAALEAATSVRAAGGSSLRALLDALPCATILEGEWRLLDPAGESLDDVDRPEDLERLHEPKR